jgi:transcription elongation factor Elf1
MAIASAKFRLQNWDTGVLELDQNFYKSKGKCGSHMWNMLLFCRDRKNQIGEASCRICQEKFSTPIDALSDPIDVYSDWIDECERINGGA